jgi:hypothetical protein
MVRELTLKSRASSLVFRIEDSGRCQIELHNAELARNLGADLWSVIRVRIQEAFGNASKSSPIGAIDGVPVAWVLSLPESHASIYLAKSGSGIQLFIQDESLSIIEKLLVDDIERARWLKLTEHDSR